MPAGFDPLSVSSSERKKYRYTGSEVIYTFWAKHGTCSKPGCGHRTPLFRSPVIAEKKLGVKYIELTCKKCKTSFHAEMGAARMCPEAERVVLENELPFTELSQPFATRLNEYSKGRMEEKKKRAQELFERVDNELGLKCPKCGAFAGQFLRDVLGMHRRAERASAIDKKHLKIEPPRNSVKPVYCYLLIDPDWLKGAPGRSTAETWEVTARRRWKRLPWYHERLKNLRFIEVRGRIKLSEDTSHFEESTLSPEPVSF